MKSCKFVPALLALVAFHFASTPSALGQLPLLPPAVVDDSVDGPNSIRLADLDRDGDLDVVIAAGPDGTGGGVLFRPFDSSTGTWGAAVTIDAAFAFALDLAVGDLDRDGDLDVAAVSSSGDELAWWENSAGDGSAWTGRTILSGSALDGVAGVEIGDVDRDGDADLVVAVRNDDAIRWFENDGDPSNGGWTQRVINAAPFDDPVGLDLVDLDRDGDLDVVAASENGNRVSWWASDGTPGDGIGGDGTSWTFHAVAENFNGARDVVAADFDGDGDPDLAAVARLDDQLSWWENTSGDGSAWTVRTVATLDGSDRLEALDMDFDGDLDLWATARDGGRVIWWERTDDDWIQHEVNGSFPDARGLAAGDIDADGDLDLVFASVSQDSVVWARNDPIHRTASFVESLVDPEFADAAVAGDIDRDGAIDIVGGGFLAWWSRQGSGWTKRLIDPFAGVPAGAILAVAVGDIDGDGDPDIAGTSVSRVFWWENDGTPADQTGGGLGTSWTRHEVSQGHGDQLIALEVADLDGDGFLDLLAADRSDDEVRWWRNDRSPADGVGGDGNSWTEGLIDDLTVDPRSALPLDVDRDGDLDVLVISQLTPSPVGRVIWWLNNGTGSSWTRQVVSTSSTALAVAAGDVDRDGDVDVMPVLGNGVGPAQLDLYRQGTPVDASNWTLVDNVGVFSTGQFFPWAAAVGDLDLDGDLDAAASVQLNEAVYWWENPAAPSAWIRNELGRIGSDDVSWLRAEQVDGRGPVDLVTASTGDGIAVWENRAAQAELFALNLSPAEMAPSSRAAVLGINARGLGRGGDNFAEIAALRFRLTDGDDVPLPDATADSIFSGFELWEDLDDSGTFNPGVDDLIGAASSVMLGGNGEAELVLPDFEGGIASTFRDYLLVAETSPVSDQQGLDSFRLTLLTGRSRMEDAFYDTPLVLLSPEDVSTSRVLLDFELPIFADGFESQGTAGAR